MIMSKMMPVPGNEPISIGEEGDDPEKEQPELPEIPDKPEIPEEPEKPEIPEEPEQPDIQGDCKLELKYSRDIWGGGYQINFKITNISEEQSSGWTLKIKKKGKNDEEGYLESSDSGGDIHSDGGTDRTGNYIVNGPWTHLHVNKRSRRCPNVDVDGSFHL